MLHTEVYKIIRRSRWCARLEEKSRKYLNGLARSSKSVILSSPEKKNEIIEKKQKQKVPSTEEGSQSYPESNVEASSECDEMKI